MKRPFLWIGISFAAGIFLSRQFTFLSVEPLSFLAVLAPLLFFCRKKLFFKILLAVSFLLLGALTERSDRLLPSHHISHLNFETPVSVRGRVTTLPEISREKRREMLSFVLELEKVRNQKVSGRAQVFLFNSGLSLEYGDEVRLWGRLSVPETKSNPGQFDYRAYLESAKIYRILQSYGKKGNTINAKGKNTFLKRVFSLRAKIRDAIENEFPFPESSVLNALLIGVRKRIPETVREDFSRTGTIHVLSVSGLNVSIVAGLVYFVLRLFRFSSRWTALLSLACVTFYVLLSGANPPVLRAGLMAGIFLLGRWMNRDSDLLNSLGIAFFALLYFEPRDLFSPGFQLSFLSVLSILILVPRFQKEEKKRRPALPQGKIISLKQKFLLSCRETFWTTAAASAGTFPLIVYYFRMISPIGLIANLFLVPLTNAATFAGLLFLPLLLLPGKIPGFGLVPALFIQMSLSLNHFLARVPFGSFHCPSPPLVVLWGYYLGLLLLVLLVRKDAKIFTSGWAFACLLVTGLSAGMFLTLAGRSDVLKIHVLRLKQGRVAFVEFPHASGNLLINTGKGKPQEEWKWVVKPFLLSRGVQHLDAILLTSLSSADTGGLEGLLSSFPCGKIYFSPRDGREWKEKNVFWGALQTDRIGMEFLGDHQSIQGIPGVDLTWVRESGRTFLEVSYAGRKARLWVEGQESSLKEGTQILCSLRPEKEAVMYEIRPPSAFLKSVEKFR